MSDDAISHNTPSREFRLSPSPHLDARQKHHRLMSPLLLENAERPTVNIAHSSTGHSNPLPAVFLSRSASEEPRLMRLRVAEMAARQRRWSMKDVANALHVDHQTVLYWNQGRSYPRLPMLLILTRLIGCTINDLLHYDG